MYEDIRREAETAAREIIERAALKEGDVLVVGCSSSEVVGKRIGSDSNEDIGRTLFEAIYGETEKKGIFLAAQCCEHLNRALIVEEAAAKAYGLERVNVIPQKHAGGSFAVAAYARFKTPVAVEDLNCARAGLDIGDTLIGMHIKKVCVPVRLSLDKIGSAHLTAARSRLKTIGGERAKYDDRLK